MIKEGAFMIWLGDNCPVTTLVINHDGRFYSFHGSDYYLLEQDQVDAATFIEDAPSDLVEIARDYIRANELAKKNSLKIFC